MLDFNSTNKDMPNLRIREVGNNKIRMERKDPYGFVYLSYERGPLPEELKGSYTSFDEANKAVDVYIRNKKG
jgi:hypothetical protein